MITSPIFYATQELTMLSTCKAKRMGSFCVFKDAQDITQEKISCSLVLKLKVFYFQVLTGALPRCITRAALFFKNVPGTFFNATHQVKAIAIGIVEVNPLVEIG